MNEGINERWMLHCKKRRQHIIKQNRKKKESRIPGDDPFDLLTEFPSALDLISMLLLF